jgi:[acyl-carrier-protein] S-malonyltransferase
MNNAFLFPGQGSQYVTMGYSFYESCPAAKQVFERADQILGFSLTSLIFKGSEAELAKTKNSQVAIFVTSMAILRSIEAKYPILQPAVCTGLSLGEYTALCASKRVTFEDCLKLVYLRGQYMQEACEEKEGGMRVVIGLDEKVINESLPQDTYIANLNCPGQVVIAGTSAALELAEKKLVEQGAKRVVPLTVSGAFHTPLMLSAQLKLTPYLEKISLQDSSIQLVMNVPGLEVKNLEEIRSFLIGQVVKPTRWEKGIQSISQMDAYIEIGPGKTLTGMNRKMGLNGKLISIESFIDLEKLNELCTSA